MNIYKMSLQQFQVNTKLLNSLPPEWSKFVTDVKLVRDLHTTNFHQLKAYLEQHEIHVNEVICERPNSYAVGTSGTRASTSKTGGRTLGQQRAVKCFNYQKEGYTARQCTEPKRKRDSMWFREKALLVEAQGNGKVLTEEELEFLAYQGIPEGSVTQTVITHNATYQDDDLDAYDFDCDDITTAKVALMANLSHYSSDVLSKEKELLTKTFNVFKNESKGKEAKNIDNEIALENKVQELDNIDLGFQNPFYLKKAQHIRPMLYDGTISAKETNVISIADSKETLMLEEENFGKRFISHQELSAEQALWFQMSNPSTDSSDASPVKLDVPRELPKASLVNAILKRLNSTLPSLTLCASAKKDIDEIETINIELEHRVSKLIVENEHLKQTYKQLYDSIKPTYVCAKEHSEALIDQLNKKSVENYDLNAQLQEKFFLITVLKNDLRKLKGKDTIDNAAQASFATTITLGMFKLDPVILAPRDKNNRETYIYYLKHTMEKVAILKEIVKPAKSLNPLDSASYSACKYIKLIQELLSYVRDTYPDIHKPTEKLVAIVLWYLDSGCSKHMKGDRSQLTNFVHKFLGLEYNLFSVGQFCDSYLEVAFRKHTCFVHNLEGVDLLSGSQETNLYTLLIGDMMASSLICLLSKASKTKSWLWHRRLSHLNFGAINHLEKHGLVRESLTYTRKIIETIHVDFDELTAMASKQSSLGSALHEMTPATPSLGIILNPTPPALFVPPSRKEWDLVFQPVFNEFYFLPTSVVSAAPVVDALVPDVSTDIPLNAEEDSHDLEVAHTSIDPYFGIPIPETVFKESSSSDVIHTTMHSDSKHPRKCTKDHSLETVRIFLTFAARMNMVVYHMDVKTTFLNGILCEKVYISHPDRFVDPDNPNHKFFKGTIDPTLFIKREGKDILLAHPTEKHLYAVKRIFRYLRGTVNRGLWYLKDSAIALTTFADADHAGYQDTRHRTSGSMQLLGDRLVRWSSKRQKSAAISSMRAEYINLSRITSSIIALQAKLDLELVPNEKRLEIGKCNGRLNPGKTQREPTFQVVLDALAITLCYSAFLATVDVPEVYMHQFWDSIHKHDTSYRFSMDKKNRLDLNLETFRDIFQICPRVHGQDFDELATDEVIVSFFKELSHTWEIKSLTDVVVDPMHQPWRTFATPINRSLSGKTTGLDKLCLSIV
nr:uncharacterized mitochondrial protein AtMg00810-like [Tanacetum cinerariifolium]